MEISRFLALNGSPRGRESNTDRLLRPFLEGAQAEGAEVETLYTADLDVKDCRGCFACWTQTPGACVIRDDMEQILERFLAADCVVWGFPLYHFGMPASLKRVLERTLPLLEPWIVKQGGHYSHPLRYDREERYVVISNCGFPERHHFGAVERHFEMLTQDALETLLASIYCPAGELLRVPELQSMTQWYLEAMYQAGRELARDGHLAGETAERLAKPLIDDMERFVAMANQHWEEQLGEPDRPAEEEPTAGEPEKGGGDLQAGGDTIRSVMEGMAAAFDPEAAGDLQAVYQFYFDDGEGRTAFHMVIADGDCRLVEGEAGEPSITIEAPESLWFGIAAGEVDGAAAFFQGRYRAHGHLGLLRRMGELFRL